MSSDLHIYPYVSIPTRWDEIKNMFAFNKNYGEHLKLTENDAFIVGNKLKNDATAPASSSAL
jgi:hypothetical protein